MPNDPNPYSAAKSASSAPGVEPEPRLLVVGATWAVFSAFPIAALLALVFRFPIPMGGYLSGPKAVGLAMFGVAFYGVFFGGFFLLAALGAVGAQTVAILSKQNSGKQLLLTKAVSVVLTTICLFVLATLDFIIGPW